MNGTLFSMSEGDEMSLQGHVLNADGEDGVMGICKRGMVFFTGILVCEFVDLCVQQIEKGRDQFKSLPLMPNMCDQTGLNSLTVRCRQRDVMAKMTGARQ